MNIYLITNQDRGNAIKNKLAKYGKVTILNNGKDLSKYSELFQNQSAKVIGMDPSITDWKFPDGIIKQMPNLKGICTRSTWAEYINLELCKKLGVVVTNCPEVNSQSVAEYAIWQMLSVARKLPQQIDDNFKIKEDTDHEGEEIMGKTMGIIGLGTIGTRIAKMGKAMGMKVIYWSRKKKSVPFQYKSFNGVLKQADFVVNCIHGCEETKNILNKKNLRLLKPTAYYVSILGGAGWGYEDCLFLAQMVEKGKLAGFSVENEHNGKFPTKFKGNVFIPGGYAWFTKEAREKYVKVWSESIIGIATGKVVNRVN